MADPRTMVGGRYAFHGLLKNNQALERWLGVETESGRRVVLMVADARRLATLGPARGVMHRHLTGVIDVVLEVDPASLPGGRVLPAGYGVAVAEYVPGMTLHGELLRSAMSPSKAVAWVLRLADAVQALHAASAVHAALSPRSVIAVPQGRPIAPVLSQLVAPALGAFCPPERLKGSAESREDDVWALHATLYAALTRQAPFDAPSRDALKKQMLSARPTPLAAFGIDEPALQEILDRGLVYEKRLRTTELDELVHTLDGWERDARSMPAKRQVPPRPAPRSLMDIVGATGLRNDRDDGIVIDGSRLPDDEGAELDPKPASSAALASSSRMAAAAPVASASVAVVSQGTPQRASRASGLDLQGSMRPRFSAAPSPTRVSINPFERKRSVWPLLLVAAVAGGGGVYLAVAPDAPPPEAAAANPTAPVARQAAELGRPKSSPSEARDSCVVSYFDDGTITKQSFAFVCEDGDFREVVRRLQQLVHPAAPDAGALNDTVRASASAGTHGSSLDWYALPATAVIRKSCCDAATPITLPETPGWCEQLQTVVRRIADDSGKAGDLAPDARAFEKAVACLFANQAVRGYAYEKAPSAANRAAFQQFLSRAAISEARR